MNKIVIAGGTGFLGTCLINHYLKSDNQLVILTRGKTHTDGNVKYVNWDGKTVGPWADELEGTDVVVNLNGKSVDCRYTDKNKALIYSTRLDSTDALGNAIQQCKIAPKLWINSASATIYRHSLDKEMDEYSGEIGSGFSVDVCQKWEAAFNKFEMKHTRKVLLRTGIVLGKNGGPMKPLKMLAKLGFGGKQGPGTQYFSWLHADDFVGIVDFIVANQSLSGAYNVTAPTPIPNQQFMSALRSILKVPIGIPLPKWLLELGAVIIGTETELVLKSRRVIPRKLLDVGYKFRYDGIDMALNDLCS
ncbi:MAG TPA: TIGR01777 family oxidoreductase [Cyclobacteriaceae bacterium]|jgi:hypothetical protein|nr:TIGR01777 family oxidoreductase [Cyclobacteriaceae bacterium]